MSVSASIDVILSNNDKRPREAVEIIQVLVKSGWSLFQKGYAGYLPLGDKNEFNWQEEKGMTFETLATIFKSKEQVNEIIGVIMTWKDTGIGGAFLFWPKGNLHTFSISIDASRQKIVLDNNYTITDFQWYLLKLLPPLNNAYGVEYFTFEEHI